MRLRRYDDAAAYYAVVSDFLLEREAEHNLLLGICAGLIDHPERVEHVPYLAAITNGSDMHLAAIRTPPHNVVLSALVAPEVTASVALQLLAEDLREEYGVLPGVLAPAAVSRTFAETWGQVSGQSYRRGMAQRIYQLEAVRPVSGVSGEFRRATEADRDLLVRWWGAFAEEAHMRSNLRDAERTVDARLAGGNSGIYLWQQGRPVSAAGYGGPTPNGIRVGPVYTPPEHRCRGYASACVSALSELLLAGGRRYCFLFTDLSNPTSNHIYQVIGYEPVCDVDEYRFADTSD